MAEKKTRTRKRKVGAHDDPAVREAHGAVAQARSEAAAAGTGVAASVTQDVPDLEVEVAPETSISHEGQNYSEGERFSLPGPDAIALIQSGHVTPAGAK